MEIARVVSESGTCSRLQVGAVLVYARRIISIGYNGAPSGMPHCVHSGMAYSESHPESKGCEIAVHAEANTIAFAAKNGISTEGSKLYVTDSPCVTCAKLLINAGIKEVIYGREYRDERGIGQLLIAGVEVTGPYGPNMHPVSTESGDGESMHPSQQPDEEVKGEWGSDQEPSRGRGSGI